MWTDRSAPGSGSAHRSRATSRESRCSLLDFDVRVFADLGPTHDLGAHHAAELIRRTAARIDTELGQRLLYFFGLDRLVDSRIQPGRHIARRARLQQKTRPV